MRSDALFERCWAEVTDGTRLEEIAARGVPAGLLDDLATARAIQQLDRAIQVPGMEATWAAIRSELEAIPSVVRLPRTRRRPFVARALVGVAAGVVVLVSISMRAVPGSTLYPIRLGLERTALVLSPTDGALHVRLGLARLVDLLHVLAGGSASDAPDLARALVAERTAALADRADVAGLDRLVAAEVPSALAGVSPEVSAQVRSILGSLLPPPLTESSEESLEAGTSGSPGGDSEIGDDGDSEEAPGQEGDDQEATHEGSAEEDGDDEVSGQTSSGDQNDASPGEASPEDEGSPDTSD